MPCEGSEERMRNEAMKLHKMIGTKARRIAAPIAAAIAAVCAETTALPSYADSINVGSGGMMLIVR